MVPVDEFVNRTFHSKKNIFGVERASSASLTEEKGSLDYKSYLKLTVDFTPTIKDIKLSINL